MDSPWRRRTRQPDCSSLRNLVSQVQRVLNQLGLLLGHFWGGKGDKGTFSLIDMTTVNKRERKRERKKGLRVPGAALGGRGHRGKAIRDVANGLFQVRHLSSLSVALLKLRLRGLDNGFLVPNKFLELCDQICSVGDFLGNPALQLGVELGMTGYRVQLFQGGIFVCEKEKKVFFERGSQRGGRLKSDL